ncbi:MAG: hypothetical protein ACOYZ6_12705 [Chloroflexota bacterium]
MDDSVISEKELIELESLWKLTTKGPWKSWIEGRDHRAGSNFIMTGGDDISLIGGTDSDQDFIALSHELVPVLIAELRGLKAKLKETPR